MLTFELLSVKSMPDSHSELTWSAALNGQVYSPSAPRAVSCSKQDSLRAQMGGESGGGAQALSWLLI